MTSRQNRTRWKRRRGGRSRTRASECPADPLHRVDVVPSGEGDFQVALRAFLADLALEPLAVELVAEPLWHLAANLHLFVSHSAGAIEFGPHVTAHLQRCLLGSGITLLALTLLTVLELFPRFGAFLGSFIISLFFISLLCVAFGSSVFDGILARFLVSSATCCEGDREQHQSTHDRDTCSHVYPPLGRRTSSKRAKSPILLRLNQSLYTLQLLGGLAGAVELGGGRQ